MFIVTFFQNKWDMFDGNTYVGHTETILARFKTCFEAMTFAAQKATEIDDDWEFVRISQNGQTIDDLCEHMPA